MLVGRFQQWVSLSYQLRTVTMSNVHDESEGVGQDSCLIVSQVLRRSVLNATHFTYGII